MAPIVATRIAINMGIFDFVHNSHHEEFKGDEIASHVGGDPLLVCTKRPVAFIYPEQITAD